MGDCADSLLCPSMSSLHPYPPGFCTLTSTDIAVGSLNLWLWGLASGGPCRRKKKVRVFIPQFPSLQDSHWLQRPSTSSLGWGPCHCSLPSPLHACYQFQVHTVTWDIPSPCHTSISSPLFSSNSPQISQYTCVLCFRPYSPITELAPGTASGRILRLD